MEEELDNPVEAFDSNIRDSLNDAQWEQEMLLKRYEHLVAMYRFYMDFVLKSVFFNYGITGSIVAFYLAHLDQPEIRWALLLPMLLSGYFIMLFGAGAHLWHTKSQEAIEIGKRLTVLYSTTGEAPADSLRILSYTLKTYTVLLVMTSIALFALMLRLIPLGAF